MLLSIFAWFYDIWRYYIFVSPHHILVKNSSLQPKDGFILFLENSLLSSINMEHVP